jgi:uncharacterized protein YxeA
MKKLIATIGFLLIAAIYNQGYSQSLYTDVYNAVQTLSGNESKTVNTDDSKIEYTQEKQNAEENLSREREKDSYNSKEEKKTETTSDPEF